MTPSPNIGTIKTRFKNGREADALPPASPIEPEDFYVPPSEPDRSSEMQPFSFYFDGDESPAPVPMLIERLIPRDGLTFLGGQSGAGKSFVAIDAAVAIATGGMFFGYEALERAGVLYIAAEGRATISSRLAAAKKARGITENLPIVVVTTVPDLAASTERRPFVRNVKSAANAMREKFGVRVGLVIIDTLAAAFSMKDENSAAEVNSICKAATEIGDALSAATLALHHYGKVQSTGLRGSSASRGAGESIIAVLAERDELSGKVSDRRLVHSKSRVGEEGPIAKFDLRHVDLGTDNSGEQFGSASVEVGASLEGTGATSAANKEKRPGRAARAYLDALEEALSNATREVENRQLVWKLAQRGQGDRTNAS